MTTTTTTIQAPTTSVNATANITSGFGVLILTVFLTTATVKILKDTLVQFS